MIRRTLVPLDLLPAREAEPAPRRTFSFLDERSLVPYDLPVGPLETQSNIPAHVPLEVLGERMVVPRGLPVKPLEIAAAAPSKLDARVVVPREVRPGTLELAPLRVERFADVVDRDVLTTGEVNLLVKPVSEQPPVWGWQASVSSVLFHALLVGLVLLQPKLFPYEPPTQAELDLARQQLAFVYLPPSVRDVPKVPPSPSAPESPKIRIDPRLLRQAPATEEPLPGAPERESPRVMRELPAAPQPKLQGSEHGEPQEQGSDRSRGIARLETPKGPEASDRGSSLLLPQTSPGRALEDSLRGAARDRGGAGGSFGDALPPSPGGGGGTGYLGGTMQMLTPDEGVDFTNYLARVLASVRRNWYAVIPESARLGDRGMVVLQFRILRNGSVPYPEPVLVLSSGKDPLDRAAVSAIRASNPFEQLPPAFSGPFIELRFIFLYNMRLNPQQ